LKNKSLHSEIIQSEMQFKMHHEFPAELANQWDELVTESKCDVPFLLFSCMQTWWETRGGGEWPDAQLMLITAQREESLVGIAPLFLTTKKMGQPTLMLLGSIEIFDYLDLIARGEDLADFIDELLDFLVSPGVPDWQVLDLYNIIDFSPTLDLLKDQARKRNWDILLEPVQPSPYITLPGDWDTYLAGIKKKQRHEIRRKLRRLEESGVDWRWYIVDDPSTLESEIEDFIKLMLQDESKLQFLREEMQEHMRRMGRCAFNEGFLQLSFLEIDGHKAATKMIFDYRNQLWAYNSGVNYQLGEYSPGWILLSLLLQWANERGYSEFDFMRGDEEYKYRFGAVDRYVMRARLAR
jgi:CelD/BcsL family acetyltransferase involved in cellulose biosynthesis